MESSGSHRYSGKLFQMVGPTTANLFICLLILKFVQ